MKTMKKSTRKMQTTTTMQKALHIQSSPKKNKSKENIETRTPKN